MCIVKDLFGIESEIVQIYSVVIPQSGEDRVLLHISSHYMISRT